MIINTAVELYGVSDFYFGNAIEVFEEFPAMQDLAAEREKINVYIAQRIREYKNSHPEQGVGSAIVVARTTDTNYDAELYDEVIQGFAIYSEVLEGEESLDSFTLRNAFLIRNADFIFWYSSRLLAKASPILADAVRQNRLIVL